MIFMVIIMLYDMAVKITGVYKAKRLPYAGESRNRRFHALSIRLRCGETKLSYRNKVCKLKSGDIAYFPAGVDYSIASHDCEELIVVHFSGYGGEALGEIEIFTPQNLSVFLPLFEDIYMAWSKREFGYKAKCTSVFYQILYHMERQLSEKHSSFSAAASIRNVIEYIHENFQNPDINVRALAARAGVSETYFRERFMEYCGCTPLDYIRNLRIEYAANLLQSQQYTINQVAENAGFNSPKYFSTVFKKVKGISPLKFSRL